MQSYTTISCNITPLSHILFSYVYCDIILWIHIAHISVIDIIGTFENINVNFVKLFFCILSTINIWDTFELHIWDLYGKSLAILKLYIHIPTFSLGVYCVFPLNINVKF